MAISVQRVVNEDPDVVIVAGSNDHLQSRGLLNALFDGFTPSSEAVGEAIFSLPCWRSRNQYGLALRSNWSRLSSCCLMAMPRYPNPCNSYTTWSKPNRQVDPNLYYPFRSELPAMWSDISSAIQGFKDHRTTSVVLNEGLGLELSSFGQLLKMRPGMGDEHRLVQRLANNIWFWQTDYVRDERRNLVRRNALSTEEYRKAMALRTEPHTNL